MTNQKFSFGDEKARIESLDFLRGIAAVGVMLFHYTAESSIHLSDENPLRIVGIHGHLGVGIFFIISGLIIPYSMYLSSYTLGSMGKFLSKRTIRLEVPYLVLIAAEVLLIYISSLTPWRDSPSERLDAYNILLHVGYLNGILDEPWLIPIFWTLAIEFQFYLLIALIFPILIQSNILSRSPIILIAILAFVIPQPFLFFYHGLYFVAGMLTFQRMCGIIKTREYFIALSGALLLIYFQHGIIPLLASSATIAIILFFKCNWKWSIFLGSISYSIYLVHIPFGGRLLVLTNIYVQSEELKSLLIIIFLALTIFVAWMFYVLIEKPSLYLSKKIKYTKPGEPEHG